MMTDGVLDDDVPEDAPLPEVGREVRWTAVATRIMQACDKAFATNNFLLLYFSHAKKEMVARQFAKPDFRDALRGRFQFLKLSRANPAGHWLAFTYQTHNTPYFAIIDPSTGDFRRLTCGDLTTPRLCAWLDKFVAEGPKFASSQCMFTAMIAEIQRSNRVNSLTGGQKLRVTFSHRLLGDDIMAISRLAPLEIAFARYAEEKEIEVNAYYFMFEGVELPWNMTPCSFNLEHGSVIHVHPLDDKTSDEPLSLTVVSDYGSGVFQVTRGRTIGAFLKSYAETSAHPTPDRLRLTCRAEILNEDLTFAEANVVDGDLLYADIKR
jgi:hypothetical protein